MRIFTVTLLLCVGLVVPLISQSFDKNMTVSVKKLDGSVVEGKLIRITNADDKEFGFTAPFDVTMEQLAFKLYWKDVKKVTYTTQFIDFLKTDDRAVRSASAWGWIRFYIDDGKGVFPIEMRAMRFIVAGTIKENKLDDLNVSNKTDVQYKVICPHCGSTITVEGSAK